MFRRMLVALIPLVSAIVLVAAAPAPAQARPGCGITFWCETDYYNNATHSQFVGEIFIGCSGSEVQSGNVTPYYTQEQGLC